MIRKLLPFLFTLALFALPALAQVAPGKPIAPAVRNFAPRYSPDGKCIAHIRGNDQTGTELWVMDADGKNARAILTAGIIAQNSPKTRLPPTKIFVDNFIWVPDSLSIVCLWSDTAGNSSANGRGSFQYVQIFLDGRIKLIYNQGGIISLLASTISPDGKSVVVFDGTRYFLTPPVERDQEHRFTRSGFRIFPLGIQRDKPEKEPALIELPDYRCVDASTGSDGHIYCSMESWDKETEKYNTDIYTVDLDGKVTPVVTTPDNIETAPALSPDGKQLAFLRKENRDVHLILREMEGEKAEKVALKNVVAYRWLPDERIVATLRTIIPLVKDEIIPLEMHDEFVVITPGAAKPELRVLLRATAISNLSSMDADNAIDLTDTRSYAIRSDDPFALSITTFSLPDISPDGKRLVYEKDGTLYLTDMPTKPLEAE